MDFEQLKETLPDAKPQTFLQAILSQPQEEDAELTFSEEIDEQFVENCKFLASPETISETDVEHWREQEFLVVAQSLDGDYLAGTLEQTFVIPSSLYKEDIEQFDKQLIDFFIAYENKEITSAILSKEL